MKGTWIALHNFNAYVIFIYQVCKELSDGNIHCQTRAQVRLTFKEKFIGFSKNTFDDDENLLSLQDIHLKYFLFYAILHYWVHFMVVA